MATLLDRVYDLGVAHRGGPALRRVEFLDYFGLGGSWMSSDGYSLSTLYGQYLQARAYGANAMGVVGGISHVYEAGGKAKTSTCTCGRSPQK
jgi:hypothetical protein